MKPVTDILGFSGLNNLLLVLAVAAAATSPQAAAELPQTSTPPPPVCRPQAGAAARIGGQVFGVAQNGNPLRLRAVASPPAPLNEPPAQAAADGRLGVAITKIPDAVRAQLDASDLPLGFGVMVQAVAENSAAAKAGLEAFDILVKLDDQKLVSGEQLVALVNAVDAKRPVAFTLLRKGRRKVVKVRLEGTAGQPAAARDADADADGQNEAAPGGAMLGLPAIPNLSPQVLDMLQQLPQGGFQFFGGGDGLPQANFSVQGSTIMTTDQGTVTITASNGERTVTITDPTGKDVFSGPFNTADDWEKIPANYRGMLPKP